MKLECFDHSELKRPMESTDNRIGNFESGKLLLSELPALGDSVTDAEDMRGWKADDSEREFAELPHLCRTVHDNESFGCSERVAFGSKAGENMALRKADKEYAKNGDTARYRQYLEEAAKELIGNPETLKDGGRKTDTHGMSGMI